MTVNTISNKVTGIGNGVTTVYPINFQFYIKSDLVVKINDGIVSAGTYSTTGGGGSTGSLVFNVAPAVGAQVEITRILPLVQQAAFTRNDPFPAKTHEIALDRIVMMMQQIEGGSGGGGDVSPEFIQDTIAAMFGGPQSGITVTYNDTDGLLTLTVTSPGLPDAPSDNVYYVRRNGTWIQMDWANIANKPSTFTPTAHTHTSSEITDLTETTQDTVAPMLVHSSNVNISFSYDDTTGKLTAVAQAGAMPNGSAPYDWDDSSTVMGDPGSGKIRGNSATMQTISQFAISKTDKNGQLPNLVALVIGDTLIMSNASGPTPGKYVIAGITVNSAWVQFDVTVDTGYSTGNPANGDDFTVGGVVTSGGGGSGIPEAPNDGIIRGRGNLGWNLVPWNDVASKPSSFPPDPHSHVMVDITDLAAAMALKAPLASPTFTGTPAAPTATAGTNTTQLATTAFVTGGLATKAASSHTHPQSDITNLTSDLGLKAPLASPALTGNPTAPTPTPGDSDTSIATTAFVAAALAAAGISGQIFMLRNVAGTATAITAQTGFSLSALQEHQMFRFKPGSNSTGATTIAIDGLAAVPLRNPSGGALVADDIFTTRYFDAVAIGTPVTEIRLCSF